MGKEDRILTGFVVADGFDEAVSAGVRGAQRCGPGGVVEIFNAATGEHEATIEADIAGAGKASFGPTRVFSDAWERYLARKARREAMEGKTTDD